MAGTNPALPDGGSQRRRLAPNSKTPSRKPEQTGQWWPFWTKDQQQQVGDRAGAEAKDPIDYQDSGRQKGVDT